jgi:phage FluMu gp28-like protein
VILLEQERDLLVCCTRQWGKSTVGAALAAVRAMEHAGRVVLVVAPTLRQSREFLLKVRAFLEAAGEELEGGNGVELRLANGARVMAMPENQRTLRGVSAPVLIVIDEAAQVKDAAYRAVCPMLATGGGQRGFFWEEWTKGEGWLRVTARATECERIDAAFLAREEKRLGREQFAQEFMCEFTGRKNAAVSGAALDRMQRRKEDWPALGFVFRG